MSLSVGESTGLVGAWMTRGPVTASLDDKLSVVERRMHEGDFRAVPVVNGDQLVGIVTDRDLRAHQNDPNEELKVAAIMSWKPKTVTPQTPLYEAAGLLLNRKVGALPVVEEGRLAGIITTSDVLRAYLELRDLLRDI